MASNRRNMPVVAKLSAASIIAIAAVIAVILAIESGRLLGMPLPAPFLLLFGSVAIAAGLAGLWPGLLAASLAAAFVSYSAIQDFGPDSLTGSPATILAGSAIAFVLAYLLGSSRDKRLDLTNKLAASRLELLAAQGELAAKMDRRTDQLQLVSSELSSVRNRLDSAIRHSPAGVLVVNADRQIESVNPAALRMLGLDSVPPSWRDIRELLHNYELYTTNGERFEFHHGPLTEALDIGKVTDNFEFRLVRPNGSDGWYRGSLAPIRSDNDSIAGAAVIMLDVTEAKHAASAMRELSRQLLQVQEDERTHLAYELHDEIGQRLSALNLNLHALQKSPGTQNLLPDCITQVEELARTIKNLSVELRPAMLDDLGLVAALRWYLERQRQRSGHGITFDANVALGRLASSVSTASFRVVQEAVSNAIKHADCTALTVRLYNEDGGLCIEVLDDGRGFDVRNHGTGGVHDNSLGLLSMSERVSQLGGEFEIESEVGQGTRVTACFPLRQG